MQIDLAKVYFTHGRTQNSYGHIIVELTSEEWQYSNYRIVLNSQIGSEREDNRGMFYAVRLGVISTRDSFDIDDLDNARALLKPVVTRLEKFAPMNCKVSGYADPSAMCVHVTNLIVASKAKNVIIGQVGQEFIDNHQSADRFDNVKNSAWVMFNTIKERADKLTETVVSKW